MLKSKSYKNKFTYHVGSHYPIYVYFNRGFSSHRINNRIIIIITESTETKNQIILLSLSGVLYMLYCYNTATPMCEIFLLKKSIITRINKTHVLMYRAVYSVEKVPRRIMYIHT